MRDTKNDIMVVIGLKNSEIDQEENEDGGKKSGKKKSGNKAISLKLLSIRKEKGKLKFNYPDQFVIDHPNFCKFFFSAITIS